MNVSARANWFVLLAVMVTAFTVLPGLRGQDASPDEGVAQEAQQQAEPPAEESTLGAQDSLLQMILASGATGVAFMAVLGLFSLVAATVALERAVNMRRNVILPGDFVDDLQKLVHKEESRASAFTELCESCRAPIATILSAAVVRHGHPLPEVEKAMEDAAASEMAELRARIRPLRTVGSVAPLVGLLGTVVGMIIAFHTASQAGLGKAELLAKGIYMALLTTAGGLSVAIPSMLLGSYFSGRAEKFFRELDKILIPVIPCLAQPSKSGSSGNSSAAGSESSPKQNKLMSV